MSWYSEFTLYFGVTSIILWITAHIILSIDKWKKYNRACKAEFTYKMVHHSVADLTNCVGTMLGKQVDIQVVFALALVVMDALQFLQCFVLKLIYKCKYNSPVFDFKVFTLSPRPRKMTRNYLIAIPWLALFRLWYGVTTSTSLSRDYTGQWRSGRILMGMRESWETDDPIYQAIGYTLGILSAIFYMTGILPTVLKVFQEKTFSRLHVVFLLLSAIGNFLYVGSVVAHDTTPSFFCHALPWTLPRMFLCFANIAILIQIAVSSNIKHNGRPIKDEVISLLRNEGEAKVYMPDEDFSDTDNETTLKSTDYEDSDHIDQLCELYMSTCQSEGMSDYIPPEVTPPLSMDSLDQLSNGEELTEEQVFEILAAEDKNRSVASIVHYDNQPFEHYDSQCLIPATGGPNESARNQGTTFLIATEKALKWQTTPTMVRYSPPRDYKPPQDWCNANNM